MTSIPLIAPDSDSDSPRGKDVEEGIEDDFAYRNNVMGAARSVRLGFIRKVYGLLSMQLLITIAVSALFMFTPPIKEFVQQSSGLVFFMFIVSIVLLISLFVKRKESPTNLVLLALFTLVQAYMVGSIVTLYSKAVVIEALVLTLAVVGSLTAYTFQTKRDFSFLYSGLFAGLMILIFAGILQMFIRSTALEFVIAVGGAFLFCLFLIFDTKMVMETLSPEEYITATINIYLDIINLFLYILRILAAANRN